MIPILILGDAPNLPTGLGRIARDLAAHLFNVNGLEVGQLGWGYDGSPWPWRVYPVYDSEGWAAEDLGKVWEWHARGRDGILLTIWDPSRCYPTSRISIPGMKRWGYFAVDGVNSEGSFGGPARAAFRAYDRVLAYSQWGCEVLRDVAIVEDVQWLPHGIDMSVFKPGGGEIRGHIVEAIERWQNTSAAITVGCVAANQPRKDLGAMFRELENRLARLWINTDFAVKAWSIPELQEIYGPFGDRLLVSGMSFGAEVDPAAALTDDELALFYSLCDVTIAPGLGEGFGYPIVESLACGTPVIAVDYAGGKELIPSERCLWKPSQWRIEGIYGVQRPVLGEMTLPRWPDRRPPEYWRGSVAHLDWKVLWPRWERWVREGLEDLGRTER